MLGKKHRDGARTSSPRLDVVYVAELNAHLRPLDRGSAFEDPLEEALSRAGMRAEIVGGGTQLTKEGEPVQADTEIAVPSESEEVEAAIIRALEALGAPKGSHLIAPGGTRRIPFGIAEGMGVYLDGTGLPTNVYAECDINVVIERFGELLGDCGAMLSYWEGPTETALFWYGPSYQDMANAIEPFVAEYPLLHGCRIVQIA